MSQPAQKTAVDAYWALDEAAEGKLELLNGVVVAMAGASPRHNLIVANIARALGNALSEGCLVFTQDQRVRVRATESYLYPDTVVVCGEPSFDERARPASLENPSAVVEVLSESTRDHDRGAKLEHYRRVDSIDEVLFVHSERRAATLVSRQTDGSWRLVDTEDRVVFATVTLTLDAIYARTESLPA